MFGCYCTWAFIYIQLLGDIDILVISMVAATSLSLSLVYCSASLLFWQPLRLSPLSGVSLSINSPLLTDQAHSVAL